MHDTTQGTKESSAPLWLVAGAAAGVLLGVVLLGRGGRGKRLLRRIRDISDAVANGVMGDEPADDDAADDPELEADMQPESEGVPPDGAEYPRVDVHVLAAFEQDPRLKVRAIEIDEPEPATIVLRGIVPRIADADHAETIAHGVPGVEHVENLIRVRRSVPRRSTRAPSERAGA